MIPSRTSFVPAPAGPAEEQSGDYDARVPVVTSDELGELSHDFNLMAAGLAEREELRETFGTYLDRDIVRLILSGRFPREGVEVVVSIMFVDVRGFTSFAERSDATEVVAALNALFEVMVPIVAEHGGHVDKFLGDGLLAVFGAPEGYRDHADRAVAAGLALARAVNRPGAELPMSVGIDAGPVVAGSIGGAGQAEAQRHRRRGQPRRTGGGGYARHGRRRAHHAGDVRRAHPPGRRDVTRHRRAQGQGGAGRGAGVPGRRGGGGGGAGHVAGRRRRTPAG